jgi:hypothetical protein
MARLPGNHLAAALLQGLGDAMDHTLAVWGREQLTRMHLETTGRRLP